MCVCVCVCVCGGLITPGGRPLQSAGLALGTGRGFGEALIRVRAGPAAGRSDTVYRAGCVRA